MCVELETRGSLIVCHPHVETTLSILAPAFGATRDPYPFLHRAVRQPRVRELPVPADGERPGPRAGLHNHLLLGVSGHAHGDIQQLVSLTPKRAPDSKSGVHGGTRSAMLPGVDKAADLVCTPLP